MTDNLPEVEKTGYFRHHRIFAPTDLQVGDIIRCKIASHREHETGPYVLYLNRRAIVLGFEVDMKNLAYTGIHIARLASSDTAREKEASFHLTSQMKRGGDLSGINLPCVIRTSRTDVIPLDKVHFLNHQITRIGRVSPAVLRQFSEALDKARDQGLSSSSSYPALDPQKSYIPGFRVVSQKSSQGQSGWPEIGRTYTELDTYDKARIANALEDADRIVDGEADIDHAIKRLNEAQRLEENSYNTFLQAYRAAAYAHQTKMREERHALTLAYQKSIEVAAPLPPAAPASPKHPEQKKTKQALPFPPIAQPVPIPAKIPAEPAIVPANRRTYLVPALPLHASIDSLSENFGKVQLMSRITLPETLWRGRYIYTKILDLTDERNDKPAYRPCAIWKTFHDRESGKLAGMELHPVIREHEYKFSYKMPIYPQFTKSRAPSYLIGDCIIRIPLSALYFHENSTANFFELPQDKVNQFATLRDNATTSGDPVRIWGLQEVPANWVENDIVPTPSIEQFKEWAGERAFRFEGRLTQQIHNQQAAHRHKLGR